MAVKKSAVKKKTIRKKEEMVMVETIPEIPAAYEEAQTWKGPLKHSGGGCALFSSAEYCCDDEYEHETTKESFYFLTTSEAHQWLPEEAPSAEAIAKLPGVKWLTKKDLEIERWNQAGEMAGRKTRLEAPKKPMPEAFKKAANENGIFSYQSGTPWADALETNAEYCCDIEYRAPRRKPQYFLATYEAFWWCPMKAQSLEALKSLPGFKYVTTEELEAWKKQWLKPTRKKPTKKKK